MFAVFLCILKVWLSVIPLFSSVQFRSVAQACPTLCDPMNRSTPGLPVHHQLPDFTQTHVVESVMPSSHLILCCPLLLLPPIPPGIRVFSNESTLPMRWPKYWSFSFSIIPSKEHPGLISFRMDWLDILAVQGTLKSLLQHHSWKASVLQRSALFMAQPSHPYMTTGKTIALSVRAFVSKEGYSREKGCSPHEKGIQWLNEGTCGLVCQHLCNRPSTQRAETFGLADSPLKWYRKKWRNRTGKCYFLT